MKKRIVLVVCSMLLFVVSNAQKEVLNADTIMKRVARVLKSDSTREANIIITKTICGKLVSKETGNLSWKKGSYKINFMDSIGKLTMEMFKVSDTTWVFDRQENSVTITSVSEKGKHTSATLFHSSGLSFSSPLLTGQNDSTAIISLFPTGKQMAYYKIMLHVDLRTYRETQIAIYYKDQSVTTYKLAYTGCNAPLRPEIFLFDPKNYPAGLEILDYRKE